MRLRKECYESGQCSDNDPRLFNFNRFLLKLSEHTWGLDVKTFLAEWGIWSQQLFLPALDEIPQFQTIMNSWSLRLIRRVEQRNFLTMAVAALGSHALAAQIGAALATLADVSQNPPSCNSLTSRPDWL
jgi:hypothetical protein